MASLRPGVREIDPERFDGFVRERFSNRPRGIDAEQPHIAKIGTGKLSGDLENPFERELDADNRPARISASQLGQEGSVAEADVDVQAHRHGRGQVEELRPIRAANLLGPDSPVVSRNFSLDRSRHVSAPRHSRA